jgi:antitoxin component of MazEF toxin-antitoxin module
MLRKLITIGSSVGVTLPKSSLTKWGFKPGKDVEVLVDDAEQHITIASPRPSVKLTSTDAKVAKLTLDFINRYRTDLERLAKK